MAEKVLSSRTVFEGRIMTVRVDTVLNASGYESTREIVEHTECISVIPVDDEGNILLVRQFRSAIGKDLLEIPAGGIDKGEDPATAVARELQEEIGFRPGKLERLAGFYTTPGFSNEYLHLFLATDLAPAQLYAEDTEGIEVVRVTEAQALRLIDTGEIEDAKSVAGLLLYLERKKAK